MKQKKLNKEQRYLNACRNTKFMKQFRFVMGLMALVLGVAFVYETSMNIAEMVNTGSFAVHTAAEALTVQTAGFGIPIMILVTLTDITHDDGSDNTPGIQVKLIVFKYYDVKTWPKPVADDSAGVGALADLVTITGNYVLKVGAEAKEIYVTLETGELKSTAQGETDGMSFLNELEFLIPGQKATALGFAQWAKNSSLVFIIPELDGGARVLGHEGYPAKMVSVEGTTGKAAADRKGMTYKFKSARKGPAPIFTGKVMKTISEGPDVTEEQVLYYMN